MGIDFESSITISIAIVTLLAMVIKYTGMGKFGK